MKLSVLDQSPVAYSQTAYEALRETTELAKHTEKLGYHRYWVSEHHNTARLASAAPPVLMAHLAAHTSRIRIGSGGIMLPNHSALKVAEEFRLLEALHKGRIDFGFGRAPGGDRMAAYALNPSNQFDPKEFVVQIRDIQAWFKDEAPEDSLYEKVKAIPVISSQPEMWILTSSGESGMLAAHFGLHLAFAHFINPRPGPESMHAYFHTFQPSEDLPKPRGLVAIFAFCSEDEEKVHQWRAMMQHRFLNLEKGKSEEAFRYEDIRNYPYTSYERQRMQQNKARFTGGTPARMRLQLRELAQSYRVEEVMIATICEDAEDRFRSYELLANVAADLNGAPDRKSSL